MKDHKERNRPQNQLKLVEIKNYLEKNQSTHLLKDPASTIYNVNRPLSSEIWQPKIVNKLVGKEAKMLILGKSTVGFQLKKILQNYV